MPLIQYIFLGNKLYKLGGNLISSNGVNHLSKSIWKRIIKIQLSKLYIN